MKFVQGIIKSKQKRGEMGLDFFKKHKLFIIFIIYAVIIFVGLLIYINNFNQTIKELSERIVQVKIPKKEISEPKKETKKSPVTDTKKEEEKKEIEVIEDPVFELPITNIDVVTGVQAFHDPGSSELHTGFDFKLPNPTEIFAPIAGTISDVHKLQMSNGLWIVDVNIQINSKWSMFIAFEPCTKDESVINQQMSKIVVKKGDTVKQGQLLGVLDPVLGSEFPHIHWQVQGDSEPVSPYDYCSESAKAKIDILCDRFGTQPGY